MYIILSFMPFSFKWYLPCRFPNKIVYAVHIFIMRIYISSISPLDFINVMAFHGKLKHKFVEPQKCNHTSGIQFGRYPNYDGMVTFQYRIS
jgi:hypothetical protein